jgi:hypothetical protein
VSLIPLNDVPSTGIPLDLQDSVATVDAPDGVDRLVKKLEAELNVKKTACDVYSAYYNGQHNLLLSTQKFRETFGSMFTAFADNWCQLVVDAVEERLNVEGFRWGGVQEGDKDAWRIWQANGLDPVPP